MKKSIKWFITILFLSGFLVACADGGENPEMPGDPGVPAPGEQLPEDGIDTDSGE